MGIAVGTYVRVSDDGRDAEGEHTRAGVRRQDHRCRAFAERLGWTVVRTYEDNDITAAHPDVRRPAFEELLLDLQSGFVQGVVFLHADRLVRMEADAARLTGLFRSDPRLVGRDCEGGTDLSTEAGRALLTVQAVLGGMEVNAVRRRLNGVHRELALQGRAHNGKRPFGWQRDNRSLEAFESGLLRRAILDIPEGKTIAAVRKEWTEAGVKPTAEGRGPLRDGVVRNRLLNPRVCGYRVYISTADRKAASVLWLPDHVLTVDGEPVVGEWDPIVTPEEWRTAVDVLAERRDRAKAARTTPGGHSRQHATYLLSGIARCGTCGSRMYGKVDYAALRHGQEIFRYQCVVREGGCGGLKRVGPPLDELVQQAYFDVARRRGEEPHEEADVDRSAAVGVLAYQQRKRSAEAMRIRAETGEVLAEWDTYTVDMRRERLTRAIRAVLVHKVGRGKRFDPAAVEIIWR
ncbi:recombinase family protein [Streptomyces fractus]|uniref:recombinase family protein n=1 Tax=Streptomyces fractus TaxID=641806 RepID=UPI003CF52F4A